MKNRIFALFLGLFVILIVPSLITACTGEKKDKTTIAAETGDRITETGDGAVQVVTQPATQAPVNPGFQIPSVEDPLWLMVSGVANLLLLLVSTLFGRFWKKARDVLNSIHEGISDNNLSEQDIYKIVKAWKG